MVGVFGFSLIILTKAKEDKKGFLVLGLSGTVTGWEDKKKKGMNSCGSMRVSVVFLFFSFFLFVYSLYLISAPLYLCFPPYLSHLHTF